jgi:hypothetical protein
VGDQFAQAFGGVYSLLASTIRAAGPWAIPMVLAAAGLVAMANRERVVSGFGVLLIFFTIGLIALVVAFQTGRL